MRRDRITGIFLCALGAAVFLKSWTYPLGTLRKPGGGLFPLIASVLLMGLSVLLTLQAFRRREGEKTAQTPFFAAKEAPRRIILGFAALIGFRYLLPAIGFAPSTCLFLFFLSKYLGNQGWKVCAAFSLTSALAAYYLFEVWLKIPMPQPFWGI